MAKKTGEPQYCVSKINTQVTNYNVYVMKASEKMLYMAGVLAIGGLVGLIFYGGLFKVDGQATFMTLISNLVVFLGVGLLALKYFLPMIVASKQKKRVDTLNKQFCDFATALTTALASGMNMMDSLNAVYKDLHSQYSEDALIMQEISEIISGVKNNISVEIMLEDFAVRSGSADITNFSKVFSTCYRTGGDIKSVVRRTTDIISEKIMIASEIETTITSNKMQANIMNVLPIFFVLLLRTMSSEFAESYASILGVIGLTVCAALTVAAFKLSQKIMDIKG